VNPIAKRFKNRLLASLPRAEINHLNPHLSAIDLPQNTSLLNGKHNYAYFLEEGIASVVITLQNGSTVEVGVIGRDGIVGIPILLGTVGMPGRTFIQIAGSGYQIEAETLKEEFEKPGEFRQGIQKYLQGFLVQTAQTAACNRLHSIEERLARWLLTCRDRVDGDDLPLTHEFLGQMLGAPRTTVTLTAGLLHRAGMIEYSRGMVKITDRSALENSACECYRTVRDEFRRLHLL
jgi:CRP-like cAMP-binding protein